MNYPPTASGGNAKSMLRLRKPKLLYFTNTQINIIIIKQNHSFSLSSQTRLQLPQQNQNQNQNQLLSLLQKNSANPITTHQIHAHLLASNSLRSSPLIFNTLLRSYSLSKHPQNAFFLYKQLQHCHFFNVNSSPSFFDSFTYSFLIRTCASLSSPNLGMQLHAAITKVGFDSHVYVNTVLVDMYVSLGCLVAGAKVFDEMPERNLVTWNVMVTGLVKWGEVEFAHGLFEEMPYRNVVSWTGIIDGYTRINRTNKALAMFQRMVVYELIEPSAITMLAILPAIWKNGDVKNCELIHGYGEKRGFIASDIRVTNCLLDTYAKCGCISSASRIFEETPFERKNLVSWTTIISAFAMHGMGREAVEYFEKMEQVGLKPNRVTFLSVLSACSHGGLVEDGIKFFDKMLKSQISPDSKHYGCLVDMLGRVGRLDEAEKMALGIPSEIATVVIWRTLLGSCSFYNNVEMGERVIKRLMEMEKGYGGDYVLMYNMLAGVGRHDDAEKMRVVMDERNASKVVGCSLV